MKDTPMPLLRERVVGTLTYAFGLAMFIWALVSLSHGAVWKFWPCSLLAFYFMTTGVFLCLLLLKGAVLVAHKIVAACLVATMAVELAVTGAASDMYGNQLASLVVILLGVSCVPRESPKYDESATSGDVVTGVPVTAAITAQPVAETVECSIHYPYRVRH